IRDTAMKMAKKYMPRCSDAALIRYIRVSVSEIEQIARRSPEVALSFMFPDPSKTVDVREYLDAATQKEDLEALGAVITSGASGTPPDIDEARVNEQLQGLVQGLARDYGIDKIRALANPRTADIDKSEICQITVEMYRRV